MAKRRFAIVLPLLTVTALLGGGCSSGDDAGDSPRGVGSSSNFGGASAQAGSGGAQGISGAAGDGGAQNTGGAGAGAGAGGASSTAGAAGEAGQGGGGAPPVPPGPPVIEALTPASGPFGALVSIQGTWLGSTARSAQLRIGTTPAFTLSSNDESFVESWTEDEIVFRYPFPAEGAITLETAQGAAAVGSFTPSWLTLATASNAPAASVIASISTAPQTVTLLFDTTPPQLIELGPEGAVAHAVSLGAAVASSVRLYLGSAGIEGVGVSAGEEPELIHLRNVDGDLVAEAAGIVLGAGETALAGGPDGACAWMHREDGWWRARPSGDGWSLDAGPLADVQGSSPDRAVGAVSDGSLIVAWSTDTGNWLDDMEAPRMQRLDASSLEWGGVQAAGTSVDDYITSLEVIDKGRGFVVRYCGSDLDPWGASSTSYSCYDGLHTPAGAKIERVSVDATASRHAFAAARAVAGYCDKEDDTFRLRTDTDVAPAPDAPIGEAILFPCQTTAALEIDPNGDFVPVVRRGTTLYLLARREAPVVELPEGDAGAP